ISASGLEAQKLATLTELNTLYLTLLQTQDLQKISDMDRQSAELNLQIAQLKYDNGLLSTADYLRFKSQLASKDVSLLQARTALQLSQLNLRNFLNLDYLPIADDLPDSDNDPLILALNSYDSGATQNLSAAALAAGKNNNTTLSVLENSLELSRRSYEISKGAFLPTLMLIGSSEFSENGIDRYKFESSSQIILNASIPLLPQLGNYANLQKAKFNYRKAQLEAKTATDGILLGTEAAVLNLVSAAKQVRASKLALDFTRQSFEQLQQRFRMDLISPKDLLDAELMLSAARIAYSNSVYNYHKARVSLMQTIGISDAATLDEMIFTGVK
ncbi:MAG: TolC family protein, partial [Candidatus Cloacimonetes bacterium]|nr:TolC family protein [Candidatus Cloacimonadota bacterium]